MNVIAPSIFGHFSYAHSMLIREGLGVFYDDIEHTDGRTGPAVQLSIEAGGSSGQVQLWPDTPSATRA